MEHLAKVSYAYINIDGPSNNPAPFIRATLFSVAPTVHCMLHPSSCGMMLRFGSHGNHDVVVGLSPITHDGALLSPERSKETSDRFGIELKWLVAVSAVDFPEEH
jgi:hypothetical protein